MRRSILKSKIHRATITQADLHYEGSITIDAQLLQAADIVDHEEVHVWNVTRGTRLSTYAISGPPGSGFICINGAAAHLMHVDDLVIIATFVQMEDAEALAHKPRVVFVDPANRIRHIGPELAGPERR